MIHSTIGATPSANFNAYFVANTFGIISPKNKIKNVIVTETKMNHTAHPSANCPSTVSPSFAAYIDNATLTRLFPIRIAIRVLSPLFLRRNKRSAAAHGNSFTYLFILYIGTPMMASSEEEKSADNSNNPTTINNGIIEKSRK
jgi:hypothetical protein